MVTQVELYCQAMHHKLTLIFLASSILIACKTENTTNGAHDLVQGMPASAGTKTPGFAMKIMSWDSLALQSYQGVEDIKSMKPIGEHSLFNVGSITKTFVAYAILNLADEGKLSLTDSLIKFFPDFKNPDIGRQVRIYHLLTHTSGLPDNRPVQQDSIYYLTADDAQNWAPILQNDTLLFAPGSQYTYSNPAFNALALIIQQVTHFKWQDYIKIKIFTPARMLTSTITDGALPDSGVTHAYVPKVDGSWRELDYGEEPTFNAAGNGGIWSSVNELIQYEKAIERVEFVSPEVKLMARTIYPHNAWVGDKPSQLGLSWFISTFEGHPMYAHTGSQGGFTADYVSIPEEGFFYCILSNTPIDIPATRKKVLNYALAKALIRPKK